MSKISAFLLPATLVLLLQSNLLLGQDQHFTQYYASPMTLNPALTGAFSGTYRMSLIYRDQWRNALTQPFATYSAAIDYRAQLKVKKKVLKDNVGVGVLFYNDRVPQTGFYHNQINVAAAYHKSLNYRKNEFLTFGLQWGLNQRNFDYENFSFDDQFNGTNGYTLPGRENLPRNNFAFGDMAIGLHYTSVPDQGIGLYAGVAMHHILEPEISFYQAEENFLGIKTNRLRRKYTAHAGLKIPLGERVQMLPRVLAYSQGPHLAVNAGSNFRFLVSEINGAAVHLGAWVRPAKDEQNIMRIDALIGMVGFEYQSFLVGFSYDATVSYWTTAGRRTGAFELSLAYLGAFENETVLCPKF